MSNVQKSTDRDITEEILRFAETGIENANGCYVTTDIEAIESCIENAKSHFVTADIEAC